MRVARRPTIAEINHWWDWAAGFKKNDSPFDTGWGGENKDRTEARQSGSVYCISCTAGKGGVDDVPRPLRTARRRRKDIIVPVFVACGDPLDEARRVLGRDFQTFSQTFNQSSQSLSQTNDPTPRVHFFVNDKPEDFFYIENEIHVNFTSGNSFEEDGGGGYEGDEHLWSVGYWAKVPFSVNRIVFGGTGGQLLNSPNVPFSTSVTYQY
jgi:hypothetical protein